MSDNKYSRGDIVYVVSNGIYIMKMEIISISGDFYTLRSVDSGAGTRLKKHRIYATEEEAQKVIDEHDRKSKSDSGYNRW
ncbi:hypothetical protein SAMN05216413_2633 [Ruminococcaceae bacterium KH2T8]|nr:hypothetical protein SAMN05216413_2633 [Ruminococcaceae bacterium KH2T8]